MKRVRTALSFQPFKHKGGSFYTFLWCKNTQRNVHLPPKKNDYHITTWLFIKGLFCVCVAQAMRLEKLVPLSPLSVGQRAMSNSSAAAGGDWVLHSRIPELFAMHTTCQCFCWRTANQSLWRTGLPSPANIHYCTRTTTFITAIILAPAFFHIL